MKVKELIEKLKGFEDFEVNLSFSDAKLDALQETIFPTYRKFNVTGVADVGYSEKIIVLDAEERG